MMADMMNFPETTEEFLDSYAFKNKEAEIEKLKKNILKMVSIFQQ